MATRTCQKTKARRTHKAGSRQKAPKAVCAAKPQPRTRRRRGAQAASQGLYRIDHAPWASVGHSPLGRKASVKRPTQLSDRSVRTYHSRQSQESFVKAVNEKFKKSLRFLGVHYRAYCCSRCTEGFVVRRWRAGCAPNADDALTIVKPIAMSPHELRRWFALHHHIAWSTFLKTPSATLAKRLESKKGNRVASRKKLVTAKDRPARETRQVRATTSAKKAPQKKASSKPKKLTAASKKTRMGKERTNAQKAAGAVGTMNYKGIEADLDATIDLLKKHIN